MDLAELKRLHDKAYLANQQTRETAANDLVFYYITQWDDAAMTDSSLLYRGEFNILKKAGRQIITDLEASPVQIDFEAKHDDNDSMTFTCTELHLPLLAPFV